MKMKTVLKILSTVIIATIISGCSVDRILSDKKAIATFAMNEDEEFIVINVNTGELVPTCEDRAASGKDGLIPCKYPNGFPGIDGDATKNMGHSKTMSQSDGTEKSNGQSKNLLREHIIIIKNFKGSFCQTIKNKATGMIYEICWPPL